jgi:hypothetical protein
MALQPKLPMTVTDELWQAMAEDCGTAFADSYLSGAMIFNRRLTPRTVAAWTRLKATPRAMMVFRALEIELVQPLPFGHPDRPDSR